MYVHVPAANQHFNSAFYLLLYLALPSFSSIATVMDYCVQNLRNIMLESQSQNTALDLLLVISSFTFLLLLSCSYTNSQMLPILVLQSFIPRTAILCNKLMCFIFLRTYTKPISLFLLFQLFQCS